jgi:ribosomal-protein-alanine N-acetyltransferase
MIAVLEELITERLVLKPVEVQYAQTVFDEFTDGTAFILPLAADNPAATDSWDYTAFIFSRTTGEFIGGCGLHGINSSRPELGIWIKAGVHSKKYGREVVSTLKQWAETNLEYDYLILAVAVADATGRKIAESLGGVLSRAYTRSDQTGLERELLEYRIYRDAFK